VNLFRQFLITDAALSQKSGDDVAIHTVYKAIMAESAPKMGIWGNHRQVLPHFAVLLCQ
jgi:hypothetical protein